jgi:hypothetical protein
MRRLRRAPTPFPWRASLIPLGIAAAFGCSREVESSGPAGPTYVETPLCEASDPSQIVAFQRIALLTSTELVNTIAVVSDAAAQMVVANALFPVITDITVVFPPPRNEQIRTIPDIETLSPFDNTAHAVGDYVAHNFAAVTACAAPASDACATAYLTGLAPKLYRRQLTSDEQTRLAQLYTTLRDQIVDGYEVTLSVEEATGYAVYALLMTPQVLWRWELGGEAGPFPLNVYLTDTELASSLSFFLTDQPPDAALRAEASAGTLRANLATHVDRVLQQQTSRDWLRHVMEIYFRLNRLPALQVDPNLYPIVAGGELYGDLQTESRLFLDGILWSGRITELLSSRKAFLNSNLALEIYDVPVPAGATPTTFVETTLPADTRSGLLTSASFTSTSSYSTGESLVIRGLTVKAAFTCLDTEGPPTDGPVVDEIFRAFGNLSTQTAQQQVAVRQKNPDCSYCHASFDAFGLVLDAYDLIGRYRTVDDLGMPVDTHATLPPELGGAAVKNAIETADVLAKSDVFTNCMAHAMLQYALLDATVELPLPLAQQKGCAVAGVAHALRHSAGQSFTDLLRAVVASPAFLERLQTR